MAHSSSSGAISVAVDPVALVVTECITVTSAMRKHARWAHSSVSAILGGSATSNKVESRPRPTARSRFGDSEKKPVRPRAPSITEEVGLANRWGLRGKKGQSMQDNPLLSAFAKLRSDLKRCKDIHTVSAATILHPFLQIIRSSSTSAPITSLALIAITKFFAYNIISKDSPELPLAMQRLSSAVTHCRFEATDSATDEIFLFRILKLMEGMITGPGGDVIGDESMCEMMETGISMCCQVRLSELLRRSAEVSMITMCQTIFERLKHMAVEPEEEDPSARRPSTKADTEAVKMDPSIDGDLLASKQQMNDNVQETRSLDIPREKSDAQSSTVVNGGTQTDSIQSETDEPVDIKPYSLPSIRELFRVLVDLLDPHERQHNDTMRVMALRIVDVALEVAGPSIANHPSLASLAKDILCRHLFQLVRSENIAILNESLRVAGTLLSTCRRVLKLQQELFLSYLVACLHPRVEIPQEPGIDPSLYDGVPQSPRLVKSAASQTNSGRSTPVPIKDRQRLGMEGGLRKPDAREAMVESVGALIRIPSFMVELFVNYDCEIDRSDLCLDMVGLLARNAFPDAATWSTTNVPPLCLDALLGYIHSIADRLQDVPRSEKLPDPAALKQQRELKKVIIKGATKFNENPKAGIAFLAAQGIIDNPDEPASVAHFLKGTTRIDKRVLGDYLSKRSNEGLLTSFMDLFDFANLRVDEALRQLLNSFRLPGEAPLIERIVNEFSAKYCGSSPPANIADKDALYILTYAIIMLNTDQHNPNVKSQNRMSFNDFARNLRGVNGGDDFDKEYLEEIYESIKTREIVLPEEHDNRHSFDHAWKELQFKVHSTTDLNLCQTNLFDAEMFAATWKPVVATLSYVFMSATDDTVFSRVVAGFDQCAQIAAAYNLHDALDHVIFCLSSISTLAAEPLPSTSLNTEVQAGERSVMVSETAVRFGRDFKAQLATVVLFRVVVGHERAIRRNGWAHVIRIILNLFINSLVNSQYLVVSSNADLPPIPLQSPAQVIDRGDRAGEGGIFSAFTSYVSSFANDEPPEPSDQEIEYTLCTVDCVNACSFDQLFSHISELPFESLQAFVRTLLEHFPDDSSPKIMIVKPDIPAPTPIRPNGQKSNPVGVAYDASLVFVLEFATILVAREERSITELGREVANALQSVVRDGNQIHPVNLCRAVYYLLSFLRASFDHDFVRAPVVLHTISKFDPEVFRQANSYIVKGLVLCLDGPVGLRNEMVNSPDFWSVLRSLQAHQEAAQPVFDILNTVVASSGLTSDNYEPVMSLLSDVASAGTASFRAERARHEAAAKSRSQQPPTKQPNEAISRGTKAMSIVLQVATRVPSFIQQSQLDPHDAWKTYWVPLFKTLRSHSFNPCRPIRSQALSSLSRILVSPALVPDTPHQNSEVTSLFTNVLFPLITQLLKPEVWHSDPAGMGETRLQAAILCTKVYLRFLDALLAPCAEESEQQESEEENKVDGVTLWSRILEMMERLVKSGGAGNELQEAVPESIKNIILVMSSSGYLAPPHLEDRTPLQKRLWDVSSQRTERFLPGMLAEVFADTREATPKKAEAAPQKPAVNGENAAEKADQPQDAREEEADENSVET
ncbi:MAG: GDP/GTP exchange factor for ARF [Chrysothrix sp. TS-e1954]|nr:MAG: GDP/GTP exchange factor for ARF [Chrysothrix sp. TS-e1954]